MFTIENQQLKVIVASKGAELQSIFNKSSQLEYMWNGNPALWAKHSPVLFPIVGTLKDNTYKFKNKSYQLSRHGFAREMDFELNDQQADRISFLLKDNEKTLAQYPFKFEFLITYALQGNQLKTSYSVRNTGNENLFFSVGGHPAFKLPLVDGTTYDDYYLEFNKNETLSRWLISPKGLLETASSPLLQDTQTLHLKKELFFQDAIVFKHPASSSVSLKSKKTNHGLQFDFDGFPFLGIWAAKNADFVCIEPWCGIADSVDTDQDFTRKEGINRLEKNGSFERSWTVAIF